MSTPDQPSNFAYDADDADLHASPFNDAPGSGEGERAQPVEVPHDQINADTLHSLVEEYVTRDGTDLADAEAKIERVMRTLRSGEAAVYWDPVEESAQIVARKVKAARKAK